MGDAFDAEGLAEGAPPRAAAAIEVSLPAASALPIPPKGVVVPATPPLPPLPTPDAKAPVLPVPGVPLPAVPPTAVPESPESPATESRDTPPPAARPTPAPPAARPPRNTGDPLLDALLNKQRPASNTGSTAAPAAEAPWQ